jgi:tRNA nucleotidyltransferase (CCA-adding enzyme)
MLANLHNADIPRPVLDVIARLHELGHAVYLVGGCVRDLVRVVPPKDFDVATSALPEEVQRAFRKVIPTGIQHGTVTVVQGGTHVEVTTFRSEGDYLDGRRPSSVAFERDIVKDLSRRDFTINAMAYNPLDRELVDPFGGQADLQAQLIRCVGSARERFSEDGLRPLRAVRFSAVPAPTRRPPAWPAPPCRPRPSKSRSASPCCSRTWWNAPRPATSACASSSPTRSPISSRSSWSTRSSKRG